MKKNWRDKWIVDIVYDYLGGKICTYCNSTKDVQLHHIQPVYLGGLNKLGNLEPVCENCHKAIHQEFLKIYPPKEIKKFGNIDKLAKRLEEIREKWL